MEVYDYMSNSKIEDLMLSKLTKEELIRAKEKIEYYRQIPHKELREKVRFEKEEENYKNLSMIDSYILHMLCKIDSFRNLSKLNSEIDEQVRKNDSMRSKSLHRALNQYKK